ncbi:uncharacterized protein LOC131621367 [Vicia villosa]|uniref:uncharacterized protein LOC131621367 n=1 Tax=Vicia villosa TaxID=3911 RepID=UPI00273C29B3|nr:uncharacterized protein LOC131621367 [Vicia villosa]
MVDLENLPPKRYYFKDFIDVVGGNFQVNRLEDVIGSVHEINNFQSNIPGKKTVVSLKIKDLSGNFINCTLWENYATQFLDFYNDVKNNGGIVIILTHAMIKDSQASNGWSGSKLLINEEIPEITEFMFKLPADEQSKKPTRSSKSMSIWSGSSQQTTVEQFVNKAKCMSLSDLCKVKQDFPCVTVATTLKFSVSKHGWFYYGCTNFTLKATHVNNPYQCSCGEKVQKAIPRYKVDVYVFDGDFKYRFVFWDTDCFEIIGKSAEDMYKKMMDEGEDDPLVYPDDLELLLGKKMAFRVKVQPSFGQGYVWKFSSDEDFVNQIQKDFIPNEAESIPVTEITIEAPVEPVVQSNFAFGENDPDTNFGNTPAKDASVRDSVEEIDCEVYGATQFFGTKPSKKVKIEPNV